MRRTYISLSLYTHSDISERQGRETLKKSKLCFVVIRVSSVGIDKDYRDIGNKIV